MKPSVIKLIQAVGMPLLLISSMVSAKTIGEITTTDGENFTISQFGTAEVNRDYFIKTEKSFVSISRVKSIARINTHSGRFTYLIILEDGEFASGRQGLLFYERVSFIDPSNGKNKTAFTPVIKDRQQNGLIFTTLSENNTQEVVEISYPNNIDTVSMNTEITLKSDLINQKSNDITVKINEPNNHLSN